MRRLAQRLTGRDSPVGGLDSGSRHGVKEPKEESTKQSKMDLFRRSISQEDSSSKSSSPALNLGLFSNSSSRSWITDKVPFGSSLQPSIPNPPKKNPPRSRPKASSFGETLSNFDACIEACDALAASSGDHGHATCVNGASSRDCSVMVSPDGELLVVPRASASLTSSSPHSSSNEAFLGGQEYSSAIVMGRDLRPDLDKSTNGFSALGWNPSRASMAIAQSTETMKHVSGEFFEEIIQINISAANSMRQACDRLNNRIHISDASFVNDVTADSRISAATMNALVKSQAGPLLFPGGTIHNALLELSHYFSKSAQSEAKRWGGNPSSGISPNYQNRSSYDLLASNLDNLPQNGHHLLQFIRNSIDLSTQRAKRRDYAIQQAEEKLEQAERTLQGLKEEAKLKWLRVRATEQEIQQILEDRVRERNRLREQQRLQDEMQRQVAVSNMGVRLESQLTPEELWELVARASEDLSSFAPIGLPKPAIDGPIDKAVSLEASFASPSSPVPYTRSTSSPSPSEKSDQIIASLSFSDDVRDDLEVEMGLFDQRNAALQANELVQDAAGTLLNVLSSVDTTKRSARIAAETTLLSIGNMQASALKALVQMEKNALHERLAHLTRLEQTISQIDVRSDLNTYIEHDKREIYGATTRLGYGDDGGQASALAVLNCHSEGVGLGVGVAGTAANYSSSTDRTQMIEDVDDGNTETLIDESDETFIAREKIDDAVSTLFSFTPRDCDNLNGDYDTQKHKNRSSSRTFVQTVPSFIDFNQAAEFLIKITRDTKNTNRGRAYRASTCYAINRQRGIRTQLKTMEEFDALCHVLDAILTGCDREAADVANAKMVMMLSQTFYYTVECGADVGKRFFPKIRLCQHSIWNDDDFWTQALFQCVTDSLTNCGVMSNFEQYPMQRNNNSMMTDSSKLKWHDLSRDERCEASSQVHCVIFAQLLALAHSMVEFGCSVDFACAFVRRLSVRHQLPLSQRKFHNYEYISLCGFTVQLTDTYIMIPP